MTKQGRSAEHRDKRINSTPAQQIYALFICSRLARPDVRYWHKADMPIAPKMSAFGGEVDMATAIRNVR